jgi:hypothetical protein
MQDIYINKSTSKYNYNTYLFMQTIHIVLHDPLKLTCDSCNNRVGYASNFL